MAGHPIIERQVLALHAPIAARIDAGDRGPIDHALGNLERWRIRFAGQLPAAYREWHHLLVSAELQSVVAVLRGDDQDSIRRRSSSPFTGLLSAQRRKEIMANAA